jgi:hypothetical protein
MELSRIIGTLALLLAVVLVAGYAVGDEPSPPIKETIQQKVEQKEAARRAAMAAQQKRKADFAKRCSGKTGLSEPELEACRAAYRKL